MDSDAFRKHGHELVDWIAEYLEHPDKYPVLSRVMPGDITAALPDRAPEDPEPFSAIMADFERVLVPGLTHWNHPGFLAYFAITGSAPGVLGEFLTAALNQQAMLWRTSPAATELEAVTLGWLRRLIGLPDAFEGVIYDTASIATLHAMVAAREAAVAGVRAKGLAGRSDVPRVCVYCSDQTHSSIDKSVIAIGLGHESLRKIPSDDRFRLRVDLLRDAIAEDRTDGMLPIAVIATVGTTSTTSIDPVPEIADICERERLWMHVDAAYAGAAEDPFVPRDHRGDARVRRIDVQPDRFTPAQFSNLRHWIDARRRGRPYGCDNSERQPTRGAILRNRGGKKRRPHTELRIARDLAQRLLPVTEQDDGLVDRGVRLVRAVHAHARDIAAAGKTPRPHRRRQPLARRRERVQRGDRRRVVDDSLEVATQAEQLPEPAKRDLFELRRRRRRPPQHRLNVERGGQELREDAGRAAGDREIGEEAGMVPVRDAGNQHPLEIGKDGVEGLALGRRV